MWHAGGGRTEHYEMTTKGQTLLYCMPCCSRHCTALQCPAPHDILTHPPLCTPSNEDREKERKRRREERSQLNRRTEERLREKRSEESEMLMEGALNLIPLSLPMRDKKMVISPWLLIPPVSAVTSPPDR